MAANSIPIGSPLAAKVFSAGLFTKVQQAPGFLNMLSGPMPKNAEFGSKAKDQTAPGYPVVKAGDLSKTAGDRVSIDLFNPLRGKPVMGDTRVQGKMMKTSSSSMDIGTHTPLLQSDVEQMTRMVELNVTAPMRLAYAAVPGFVERGHGAIINIASIVAISPETLNGVYGGSKAFVLAFSQSLQHELADKGVQVQAVLPGATATDFWAIGGLPVEHLDQRIVMRTEDLVDAALLGFERGEKVSIPSLHAGEKWDAYEAARQAMAGQLSSSAVAPRYAVY